MVLWRARACALRDETLRGILTVVVRRELPSGRAFGLPGLVSAVLVGAARVTSHVSAGWARQTEDRDAWEGFRKDQRYGAD
jgi:hypothetical protein